jgi:hypothetical protein
MNNNKDIQGLGEDVSTKAIDETRLKALLAQVMGNPTFAKMEVGMLERVARTVLAKCDRDGEAPQVLDLGAEALHELGLGDADLSPMMEVIQQLTGETLEKPMDIVNVVKAHVQGPRKEAAKKVRALLGGGTPVRRDAEQVGRNDKCPCGSGKKYKNCHMNQQR